MCYHKNKLIQKVEGSSLRMTFYRQNAARKNACAHQRAAIYFSFKHFFYINHKLHSYTVHIGALTNCQPITVCRLPPSFPTHLVPFTDSSLINFIWRSLGDESLFLNTLYVTLTWSLILLVPKKMLLLTEKLKVKAKCDLFTKCENKEIVDSCTQWTHSSRSKLLKS